MKLNYILLLLFIGLFYSSCKKENKTDLALENLKSTKVYAGVSDTSLFNYTFINPIAVSVNFDTMNLYGVGTTSIDFDLNGVADLSVVLNLVNPDSVHLLNGNYPNPSPSCMLESSSDLSLVMRSQEIQVNNTTTTYYWGDTVSNGEEIDADLEWSSVNTELGLWKEVNGFTQGTWSLIEGVSYIGFKFNGKFGWLEVDATNPYNPLFTKFAMQR